ncbi:hypothetical protein BD626DRAFT_565759 [Schizophyllum amplum]|uniref:Uncharacterized protein n=1 Tax=Schizophyllum amplum TaxID=97359 RepID=A0A550CPC8_9AGAR|nr:hypothetical protein BD626DRAFT_565759 [Auriculariopsis ampla]
MIFVATDKEVAIFMHEWKTVRRKILGTIEEHRTRKGKAQFEVDAATLTQNHRCQPGGLSIERPQNVTGPVKGSNPNDFTPEAVQTRGELGEIHAKISVHMLRGRFVEQYNILNAHAEAINLPRVGSIDNCCFPSTQANFGTACIPEEAQGLELESGKSGDSHADETDAPGQIPPMAPPGTLKKDLDVGAIRFLTVAYANARILDGGTLHNLCATAGESGSQTRNEVRMGPDSTTEKAFEDVFSSENRNYARDGLSIMPLQAVVDYLVRSHAFLINDTMRQTRLSFTLDMDLLCRAISVDGIEGTITARPWKEAPQGYTMGGASGKDYIPRPNVHRKSAFANYRQLCEWRTKYIPLLAAAPRTKRKAAVRATVAAPETKKTKRSEPSTTAHPRTRSFTSGKERRARTTDVRSLPSLVLRNRNSGFSGLRKAIQTQKKKIGPRKRQKKASSPAGAASQDDWSNDRTVEDIVGHHVVNVDNQWRIVYEVKYKDNEEHELIPFADVTCDQLLGAYHMRRNIVVGPQGQIAPDAGDDAALAAAAVGEMAAASINPRDIVPVVTPGNTDNDSLSPPTASLSNQDIPLVVGMVDAVQDLVDTFERASQLAQQSQTSMSQLHTDIQETNKLLLTLNPAVNALLSEAVSTIPTDTSGQSINTDGHSMAALMQMPERLQRIGDIGEVVHLEAHFQRQGVMFTNLAMERWIHMLTHHILAYGALSCYEDTWISALYKQAYAATTTPSTNASSISFNSRDAHSAFLERIYTHAITSGYVAPSGSALAAALRQLIRCVLDTWFGLGPPSSERCFRVWLTDTLLKLFKSDDVLLLEPVWRAYCHPKSAIIKRPNRSRYTVTASDYRALEAALTSLPMVNSEDAAYSEQSTLYARLITSVQTYLDDLRDAQYPNRRQSPAKSIISHIPPPPSAHSTLPLDGAPYQLSAETERAIEHILHFLRDLKPLLSNGDGDGDGSDDEDGALILRQAVRKDQDGLLPFRERGPSRRIVTHPAGPYGAGKICTLGGIFSAIVFRGILFKTPGLLKHTNHGSFVNFDDWMQFRGDGGDDDEEEYCNKSAYGPTDGRTTNNVKTFWKLSPGLYSLLNHATDGHVVPPTFHEVFKHVKDNFPTFGKLTAFLVAGDLSYTGVVSPIVTADELGSFIWTLKMGALNGLRKLLVPATSKAETISSVNMLYRELTGRLSEEERAAMGWDLLTFEHALCKFSKMVRDFQAWQWCTESSCPVCSSAASKSKKGKRAAAHADSNHNSSDNPADGERPRKQRKMPARRTKGATSQATDQQNGTGLGSGSVMASAPRKRKAASTFAPERCTSKRCRTGST